LIILDNPEAEKVGKDIGTININRLLYILILNFILYNILKVQELKCIYCWWVVTSSSYFSIT